MRYVNFLITLFVTVVVLCSFSGCDQDPQLVAKGQIVSATPDPDKEIVVEIGDNIDLAVICNLEDSDNVDYRLRW